MICLLICGSIGIPLSLALGWVALPPQPIWSRQVLESWFWRETLMPVGQPMFITGRDFPFPWDPLGSAIQALFRPFLKVFKPRRISDFPGFTIGYAPLVWTS